jgi:hypothetical protein
MDKHPDKGKKDMECYRAACSNSPATWYNHSTRMFYCVDCAGLINNHNKRDAFRMFGHELCTNTEPEDDKEECFVCGKKTITHHSDHSTCESCGSEVSYE